jgi:hypothetical protein
MKWDLSFQTFVWILSKTQNWKQNWKFGSLKNGAQNHAWGSNKINKISQNQRLSSRTY